ncbi:MAG: hypothetical protein ACKO4W_03590, partial [Bacteroidota bacterium]
ARLPAKCYTASLFSYCCPRSGLHALWYFGGGLPMNAYPPPKFVTNGIFRLIPHPIYTGFVLACFGASLYGGRASGL